jgi:DNA-directed RNA polymerase subunit beta
MAQTFTGRKRVRKVFGHVKEVGEMPNLIEVQKASYDQFLLMDPPKGGRPNEGLQSVFKSVFPIKDFGDTAHLEFVKYEYEAPKYDVDECRQRGMTYSAPLKVTLRLIVFDVDPETQAKSVKDIKEQDVYMGDMPLMTINGTFIVNGTERVIVSQMHRSPACSSITTRARAIPRASFCSLPASSLIAAHGSTLSSMPRTSSMRASTGAARSR